MNSVTQFRGRDFPLQTAAHASKRRACVRTLGPNHGVGPPDTGVTMHGRIPRTLVCYAGPHGTGRRLYEIPVMPGRTYVFVVGVKVAKAKWDDGASIVKRTVFVRS
ncbi:MAG: hypothetical protein JW940_06045 [Polyangiaceae bacterium]|nr:hypothetical protein [Polyangiaceae bacterium]